MSRSKITIVGAGNVGAAAAQFAALKELGDVVLVDIKEGVPQGKALDIYESNPVEQVNASLIGTNSYDDTKGSDIVIITAGIPRKEGMSRDDLIATNVKIVSSVCKEIKKGSPKAIVIIVSNPLDAMVYTAYKTLGFPKERVMGMAGVLDSTRFRSFIALEAGVSVESVNAMVLGGHGDQMIPLTDSANIGCVPLSTFLTQKKIDAIVARTRKGGGEFLPLLGTSAWIAPGASVIEMAECILKDQKKVLPCAAMLSGEYGTKGVFIGVPALLGSQGVEKVIEVDLTSEQKKAFKENVAHVKELMKVTGL